MKFLPSLLLVAGLNLSASELYVDYSSQNVNFKAIDVEMSGGTVGYSWGNVARFYVEGNIQSDSKKDINYYDVTIGFNGDIVHQGNLRIGYDLGVGVGQLDVPWYSNKNTMVSIPVGLTFDYSFTDKLALNAGVGYKYFFDLTDDQLSTVCNDGTTSESTGSGTCSWHGGIAGYSTNDLIGNGGGMSAQVGLTFKF